MATDAYQIDITADADGDGVGYTPPFDSRFLYHIRFEEDADDPVTAAAGESNYSIVVSDEDTGKTLMTITDIVNGRVYPVKVPAADDMGKVIDGEYVQWQTNGRIRVAISSAAEDAFFKAFITYTTNSARIGVT